jgi:8-oxo-dGTP diphosphatase
MATPRIAAGVLFTDEAGRVFMVRPTYKNYWDIPGGYVEPGESPYAACIREVREELSITPEIAPQPLVIDWAPAEGEGDKILFIFGGSLTADQLDEIAFADGELAEVRFISPADLDQYTIVRLARRLRTALDALKTGRPVYAEHGIPMHAIPKTT